MNESYCSYMEKHVLTLNELYHLLIIQACILFYIAPPPSGEGKIIKRFGDEGKNARGKKKKKKLEKIKLLAVVNHKK